jgi:hypothetical protein
MPTPRTPHEAVLQAARDVTKLDTALDAEMMGAALLGGVYAIAEEDRAEAVRQFVGDFLAATTRRRTPSASAIRQVFAALVPAAPGAAGVRPAASAPPWAAHLGRVRLTGSFSYGDVYGDQTSYLATFAYDDGRLGGPEHAVVALIDHNIGIAKDVFVGGPAERILGQVREMCAADALTWFGEVDPARLRAEVGRHLDVTDGLSELPGEGSLATDRALVGARLALLPAPDAKAETEPEPPSPDVRRALVEDFLASPEAASAGLSTDGGRSSEHTESGRTPATAGTELGDDDRAALQFCLSLVLDHAETFDDVDPLRWSPAVVGLFLLDWVHRRAVLDETDAAMLPRVVRAWVGYAARKRGLPEAAATQSMEAVDELAGEFARLYATGERRSAATSAVARLIAEGVDPNDPVALNAWLETNRNGDRPG